MTPFTTLIGIAAPLPIANVDTDQIIPSRYLKGVTRNGLGEGLLAPLRYDEDGAERPEFILNRPPWRNAKILVARDNFGCGSSREHAPWALAGFGIGAILAPSFADIFYNNSIKNGLLPAILEAEAIERLLALVADPQSATLSVDLTRRVVTDVAGREYRFDISDDRRDALLSGLDDIGRSLAAIEAIDTFERRHLAQVPPIPSWPELESRLG
ncbi:3-isopropylmalate dehydratase small subunit [Sphingomonas jaspsi]|uniref:3-isopropylmalate dehydratase small subunit n=1 Tax=Sphingomonas jaspsi TaxID=392409 RepID=UPI0004B1CFCD|nr:3-isopropylmalate dehydratase small subunit [Sphingomonas jaspsi]